MSQIHEWRGASGRRYSFQVHALPVRRAITQPGVYLFCRQNSHDWEPLDVGQLDSLAEVCTDTPTRQAALAAGATHVHLHVRLAGFDARVDEEADLRAALFNP